MNAGAISHVSVVLTLMMETLKIYEILGIKSTLT
jgi:hypothetical protein